MAIDYRSEFQRPLPIILAAVAVVGWLLTIYEMRQSSADAAAAAQQIRQLDSKVTEGQAALDKLKRDAADAAGKQQAALDKVSHDRDENAQQLAAVRTKLTDVQAAADKVTHERDDTLSNLRVAQQDVAKAQATVTDLQAMVDKARLDRNETTTQLDAARRDLADTQAKLAAAQQELTARPAEAPAAPKP